MKKFILILCILSMVLAMPCMVSAAAAPVLQMDFENGGIEGVEPYLFPSESDTANVRVESGKLVLTAANGYKIANAAMTQEIDLAAKPVVYFDFAATKNSAYKTFGLRIGGTDTPVFEISGGALSVGGSSVATVEGDVTYRAAVAFLGEQTVISLGNSVVFNGKINGIAGTGAKLYFDNMNMTAGVTTQFILDNILVLNNAAYAVSSNIMEGQFLTAFHGMTVDFGAPVLTPVSCTLTSEGQELNVQAKLMGDVLEITSDAQFQTMHSYTISVQNIYAADGSRKEDCSVTFMIAPEDYVPPQVTISPLKKVYRPGETVQVDYQVESPNQIIRTELYVDGTKVAETADLSGFTYQPQEVKEYKVKVVAYDSVGGNAASGEEIIKVGENQAPVIEFVGLGTEIDLNDFRGIQAKITDDVEVAGAELYIDGEPAQAVVSREGDIYTFSEFEYYYGSMAFTVKATDNEGVLSELSKTVTVSKTVPTEIVSKNFEDGSMFGGSFNSDNKSGEYTFSNISFQDKDGAPTKVLQAQRVKNTTTSQPYVTCNVQSSGTFTMEFDLFVPDSSSNFTIVTRGGGATDWPANVSSSGSNILLKNGKETITKAGLLTANQWHSYKYVCNSSTFTYWFYMDGEMLTPPEGYDFLDPPTSSKVADLRLQFTTPLDKVIYFDNMRWANAVVYPYIMSSSVTDGSSMTLKMSNALDSASIVSGSMPKNIQVYAGDELLTLEGVSVNGADIKLYSKAFHRGMDYKVIIGKSATFNGGTAMGANTKTNLNVPFNPFDVTNVQFTQTGTSASFTATVQNLTEDSVNSIAAVVVLKDKKGAVQKVLSSDTYYLQPMETTEISMSDIDTMGFSAELFFLNGWDSCLGVTSKIYKP